MEKRCKTCSDSNTERKLLVIGVEYWDSNVLKDKSMHLYEHLRFFFFFIKVVDQLAHLKPIYMC